MKRILFLVLFALAAVCAVVLFRPSILSLATKVPPVAEANPPSSRVPAAFFGLNLNARATQDQPWPAIPFGSFRFWDSATGWAQINTEKDQYDWTQVDKWLTALKAHN